jgi:hypothetical protein
LQSFLKLPFIRKNGSARSPLFLKRRYLEHPEYKYYFFGFFASELEAVVVLRRIETNGASCLRIIDFISEKNMSRAYRKGFLNLLEKFDAEYIDFYQSGIPAKALYEAGFTFKQPDSKNIIPDHFEPYEPKNISIRWAYKAHNFEERVLVKGDCDQDRPNT